MVAKGAVRKVGPLRDVEDLLSRRLGERAALGWPELTQDPEEGRLAATVGTRNQQVHSWLDHEAHLGHEHVAVGAQNWNVLEDDVVRESNLCTLGRLLELDDVSSLLGLVASSRLLIVGRGNHDALILPIAQVCEHLVHLVDQRRVASQVLHLFVRYNKATDCLGEIDQQRRVANIVLCDLSLIVAKLGEVLLAVGTKNGKADDCVADHDSAVLHQHRVIDAHQESLLQHEADVRVQLLEA